MKRTFSTRWVSYALRCLPLLVLPVFFSCSDDNDSQKGISSAKQTLIGTWSVRGFSSPDKVNKEGHIFEFTSNALNGTHYYDDNGFGILLQKEKADGSWYMNNKGEVNLYFSKVTFPNKFTIKSLSPSRIDILGWGSISSPSTLLRYDANESSAHLAGFWKRTKATGTITKANGTTVNASSVSFLGLGSIYFSETSLPDQGSANGVAFKNQDEQNKAYACTFHYEKQGDDIVFTNLQNDSGFIINDGCTLKSVTNDQLVLHYEGTDGRTPAGTMNVDFHFTRIPTFLNK